MSAEARFGPDRYIDQARAALVHLDVTPEQAAAFKKDILDLRLQLDGIQGQLDANEPRVQSASKEAKESHKKERDGLAHARRQLTLIEKEGEKIISERRGW